MNTAIAKRLLVVWVGLSLITLVYLGMDYAVDSAGVFRPSSVVTVGAIAIALIKVRLIFREFMEVRRAPALLARLTDLCVALIGATLLTAYFLGTALR